MLSGREEDEFRKIAEALKRTDPQLVRIPGPSKARSGLGVLLTLTGLVLLVVAVAVNVTALGVAGFVISLAGAWLTYRALRQPVQGRPSGASPGAASVANGGLTEWAERRWQKRNGGPR